MVRQRLVQILKVRLVEMGPQGDWGLLTVGQMVQVGFEPGRMWIVFARVDQTRLALGLLWMADQTLLALVVVAVAVEPLARMGN